MGGQGPNSAFSGGPSSSFTKAPLYIGRRTHILPEVLLFFASCMVTTW
jgi:hypothetical protein